MEEVENGDDKAQLQLGVAYYNGDGVKQNYREVYHWFSKAIEQRNDEAKNWMKF
jgi:TPR repeat protein